MTHVTDLPEDVLRMIFVKCEYRTFVRMWRVCKQWKRIIVDRRTMKLAFRTSPPYGCFVRLAHDHRTDDDRIYVITTQHLPDGKRHGLRMERRVCDMQFTAIWEYKFGNLVREQHFDPETGRPLSKA